ncbi:type II CAAX endopeptidase family protein [Cohnella faecalis]|uniref:CPBP family intramembrane metalloprotease n=1 Tax=Cohnella faecalis TaxID=2315694 RepID=A0A398CX47_9BACL|nr:CPBP family intramembrane glutamic endopeptidase [Cohnella faecalis]RIE04407.1 CPBP family intramembrane metalloprotease [Cohnella faecalis]
MKNYIRMIVNLVLYLGVTFLVFWGVGILKEQNETFKRLLDDNPPVLLIICACIIYLILTLLFQVRHKLTKSEPKRLLDAVGFRKLNDNEYVGSFLVGAGCALFFFGLMTLSVLPEKTLYELNNYVDVFSKSDAFVFAILGAGVIGVLFEEVYFRGLVFGELRRVLPLPVAFLAHAAVYAYFQPNLTISITGFFLALFYSFMYVKTKSVWSTVTAAATLNITIVAAKEYGLIEALGKGNDFMPVAVLVVGAIFVLLGLFRISRFAGIESGTGGKVEAYLKAIAAAGAYIAIYYAVLTSVIYIWTQVLTSYEPIRPWLNESSNNLWALVINDIIAVALYFFILRRYRSVNLFELCGFSRISRSTVVQIAILSISMGLWVTSIAKIPYVEETFPQFDTLFNSLVGGPLLPFIVFLLFHSVYKEILFRGLIFNAFKTAMPLAVVFLLDALVYGQLFFQWDPALTIYGGMGTVIFGLLYLWYRSLWAPIVAQLGLFATYYAARHSIAAFEIEFNGAFYAVMVVSSASVLFFMIRLWKKRTSAVPAPQPSAIPAKRGARAGA